jgi:hypothetical protein
MRKEIQFERGEIFEISRASSILYIHICLQGRFMVASEKKWRRSRKKSLSFLSFIPDPKTVYTIYTPNTLSPIQYLYDVFRLQQKKKIATKATKMIVRNWKEKLSFFILRKKREKSNIEQMSCCDILYIKIFYFILFIYLFLLEIWYGDWFFRLLCRNLIFS